MKRTPQSRPCYFGGVGRIVGKGVFLSYAFVRRERWGGVAKHTCMPTKAGASHRIRACFVAYLDVGRNEGLLRHDQPRDEEDELCCIYLLSC